MTSEEFNNHVEEILTIVKGLLVKKRGEYADDDDVLRNFKNAAKLRPGFTPEQALEAYSLKHAVSLNDIIEGVASFVETTSSGKKVPKEIFYEKLIDYINYLILLSAVYEDQGYLV